jgi:hypothetical protein
MVNLGRQWTSRASPGSLQANDAPDRHTARIAIGALGCASQWQVQMMPRDSGKVYVGDGRGDGRGGGQVLITIEGRTYSGPIMRTASSETFGFVQLYGARGQTVVGTTASGGGTVYVKALLASADNHGLRCDLSGDGMGHLGGICVDDEKRVYDVLAHR